ncbi:MAG: thiamine pyrophosphate-dependent enzyme [Gemmataceae bacterium]
MGRMTLLEALQPLARHRGDRIVVTTMASVGVWPTLCDSPLDFHYLPSSMGQGVPFGLGLALSHPGRGVVVITGDGGLLMNLGCLVTLASHPDPVSVVLIDNGLYEVTGGQDVAGAGRTDFADIARGSGLKTVQTFATRDEWSEGCADFLSAPAPSFAWLKVQGERGRKTPSAPRSMAQQISRLREALGVPVS